MAFLQGHEGDDTRLLDQALQDRQVLMLPVVLTELLSDAGLSSDIAATFADLPMVDVVPGYWQRVGALRAKVLAKRRRARLGDALIAQSCVDHGVSLLTRDPDFRAFAETVGLRLVVTSKET
jgi:predicted nucleic acid-binding protein